MKLHSSPNRKRPRKSYHVESVAVKGENLDPKEVRSSVAHCPGINNAGLVLAGRNVESVVEMPLDGYSLAGYSGTEGTRHPYPESGRGRSTSYSLPETASK